MLRLLRGENKLLKWRCNVGWVLIMVFVTGGAVKMDMISHEACIQAESKVANVGIVNGRASAFCVNVSGNVTQKGLEVK